MSGDRSREQVVPFPLTRRSRWHVDMFTSHMNNYLSFPPITLSAHLLLHSAAAPFRLGRPRQTPAALPTPLLVLLDLLPRPCIGTASLSGLPPASAGAPHAS